MKLILASQSPRRRELLLAAGLEHTVRPASIDESPRVGEDPVAYVERIACEKAIAVPHADDEIVLAADTTVVVDAEILGKPLDRADARRMLGVLSGRCHEVITGICLRHRATLRVSHAATSVWFAAMTPADIEEYALSDEPFDKAGGYAIQGIASRFVERIDGSYSNVVGLPVSLVWRELGRL